MSLSVFNGGSWSGAKDAYVWNGSSWVQAKKIKVWNGSSWALSWVPKIPSASIGFSKTGVVTNEAYNVVAYLSIPAPEGTSVTFSFPGYSHTAYPTEGASSVTLPGASHGATGTYTWTVTAVTKGGTTVSATKSQTVTAAGIPVNPPNIGNPITFSERYSLSNTTTTITQYAPIYLAVQATDVVEWVYSKDNGASWWAFDRKSRPNRGVDAGYGGYAKTCIFPDTPGTWLIRARWGSYTTNSYALTVTGGGGQWNAKMQACLNVINAGPTRYYREYGYVADWPNDGDTYQFQNTDSGYVTKIGLGFTLTDDYGNVRSASDTSSVGQRFLGVQAPEYSEDGSKDWGWGKSAWRRVNEEMMPIGTKVRLLSMNASGRGFDSSRGTGNFRICRGNWVNDLGCDANDIMLDEGLAKAYTQNDTAELSRADANLARTERASLAGIGQYRNSTQWANKWQVTFDGDKAYLTNVADVATNVTGWWVLDAAAVSNAVQLGSGGAPGGTVAPGGMLEIPYSAINNSGVETVQVHENQGDNEPGDVICWAARGGTSPSMRPIEMAINRSV